MNLHGAAANETTAPIAQKLRAPHTPGQSLRDTGTGMHGGGVCAHLVRSPVLMLYVMSTRIDESVLR